MISTVTSSPEKPIYSRSQRNAAVVAAYRKHVEEGRKFPAEAIAPLFDIKPRTVYNIIADAKKKTPNPQ